MTFELALPLLRIHISAYLDFRFKSGKLHNFSDVSTKDKISVLEFPRTHRRHCYSVDWQTHSLEESESEFATVHWSACAWCLEILVVGNCTVILEPYLSPCALLELYDMSRMIFPCFALSHTIRVPAYVLITEEKYPFLQVWIYLRSFLPTACPSLTI